MIRRYGPQRWSNIHSTFSTDVRDLVDIDASTLDSKPVAVRLRADPARSGDRSFLETRHRTAAMSRSCGVNHAKHAAKSLFASQIWQRSLGQLGPRKKGARHSVAAGLATPDPGRARSADVPGTTGFRRQRPLVFAGGRW